MDTSLNIETTINSKQKNKNIPYINPEASSQELLTFSQDLINLTNQSYVKTTKISKVNLDSPTEPAIPITRMDVATTQGTYPTFTVDNPVVNLKVSDISATTKIIQFRFGMPYTSSAPILTFNSADWSIAYSRYGMNPNSGTANNTWTIGAGYNGESIQPQSFVMHVHFNETANYRAFDLDVTVNITEG